MNLTLRRFINTQQSTIGVLEGLVAPIFTLEDRWQDNKPNVSCIPAGTYVCKPHAWERNAGNKFLKVWEVCDVPGRSAILFHQGNTHNDTRGCILVGFDMKVEQREGRVWQSVNAIDFMRMTIGAKSFTLNVVDHTSSHNVG